MGAALGLDPGTSRAKLYRRLTGTQTPSELKPNKMLDEMFALGNENEHKCIADIEIAAGLWFEHTGENQITTHIDRIRSTPDGLCDEAAAEAKCVSAYAKWMEPKPIHIAQCQTHMYVNDLEYVAFGRWQEFEPTMVWMIERSDAYIDWMLETVKDFLRCLDEREVPKTFTTRPVPPAHKQERIR